MTIETYNRLAQHYGHERVAKMFPRAVRALLQNAADGAQNNEK